MTLLYQQAINGKFESIMHSLKDLLRNGLIGDDLLHSIESLLVLSTPCTSSSLLKQASDRGGYGEIALDELLVVVH